MTRRDALKIECVTLFRTLIPEPWNTKRGKRRAQWLLTATTDMVERRLYRLRRMAERDARWSLVATYTELP